MKRLGVVLILILSFCGLANSAYLAQNERNSTPLICTVDNLSDCNIVAASPYARIFGIPLAEYGVVFYASLFIIAALELVVFDRLLRRIMQGISLVGLAASLYFTFIEFFILRAFCLYCLVSAGIALLIFVFACLIEPLRKRPPEQAIAHPPA